VYRIRLVAITSLAWWKARPWLRNEVLWSCGNVIATFLYMHTTFRSSTAFFPQVENIYGLISNIPSQ
jgi:hypothetical protein